MRKRWMRLSVVALVGFLGFMGLSFSGASPELGSREAEAVIGMPWTPMSYAGVARRTVRRSTYYHTYYYR